MKDNELASVQAELAQAREQSGEGVDAGTAGWWIGGGVLLALVLLGGWLLQRRADRVPRFRAPTVAADPAPPAGSLASAFAGTAATANPEQATPPIADPARVPSEPDSDANAGAGSDEPGEAEANRIESATPVTAADATADSDAPAPGEGPGQERLDLARAYLDLGDRDSARQLLTELVVNGDLASRQQATRMLRELD